MMTRVMVRQTRVMRTKTVQMMRLEMGNQGQGALESVLAVEEAQRILSRYGSPLVRTVVQQAQQYSPQIDDEDEEDEEDNGSESDGEGLSWRRSKTKAEMTRDQQLLYFYCNSDRLLTRALLQQRPSGEYSHLSAPESPQTLPVPSLGSSAAFPIGQVTPKNTSRPGSSLYPLRIRLAPSISPKWGDAEVLHKTSM